MRDSGDHRANQPRRSWYTRLASTNTDMPSQKISVTLSASASSGLPETTARDIVCSFRREWGCRRNRLRARDVEPNASDPSVEALEPRPEVEIGCGVKRDALERHVLAQSGEAELPAQAALLPAAERDLRLADVVRVHPDVAGVEPAHDP